jgi:hypothetical protein
VVTIKEERKFLIPSASLNFTWETNFEVPEFLEEKDCPAPIFKNSLMIDLPPLILTLSGHLKKPKTVYFYNHLI